MVNVVFALVSLNGLPAEFKVDQWEFTRKGAIAGRVWADENEDGIDNLEYGLEGVSLRLVDDQSGSVVGVAKSTRALRRSLRSTEQARITFAASGSSRRASSKCSKVANSCLRALAAASASWMAFSNDAENDGTRVSTGHG